MAKQTINLGTMADNKSGDPLRTAFTKVNENFTELYAGAILSGSLVKDGATVAAIEEAINEYGATLDLLQEAFAGGVEDPNYPWGANPEQLNYLTYEQLMNFNEGVPSQAQMYAVDKAHNADIAYRAYRDLIVSATVSSGEKEWSFDNEGVLTLPTNGTIKDSDGNVVIANLGKLIVSGGTIGTTNDNGGWGGYDIYLAPNGEGWAWIGVPRDVGVTNGQALVIGNVHSDGGGVQIQTNGATWNFQNGGTLQLPFNGDIVDIDGNSVLHNPTSISSGNTAPGSAVVAEETVVSVNFSDGGSNRFRFRSDGKMLLSNGGDVLDNNGVSVLAKRGVSQQTPSSYGTLTAVESSPASNVNWAYGTGVAGGVSNANIGISITDGVPTFTINEAGLPGRYVGEQILTINGSAFGGTDGIDDMIINVSAVSDSRTEIDLTKSVHVLDDGDYDLLDGYEGQVLTFVPKINRSVWVKVSNLSYMGYDDNSQSFNLRAIGTDYWINPFWVPDQTVGSTQSSIMAVTAVFANGAWNFSNGIID